MYACGSAAAAVSKKTVLFSPRPLPRHHACERAGVDVLLEPHDRGRLVVTVVAVLDRHLLRLRLVAHGRTVLFGQALQELGHHAGEPDALLFSLAATG
jgi:hypothetical protein